MVGGDVVDDAADELVGDAHRGDAVAAGELGERLADALASERLAGRVERFGQAVGVEQEAVARIEPDTALDKLLLFESAERGTTVAELLDPLDLPGPPRPAARVDARSSRRRSRRSPRRAPRSSR